MAIADGLHTYHQQQQDERDRLIYAIHRFQQDIASMQAKLAAIDAGQPDVEAALRREGREPVIRPRPQPSDTLPGAANPAIPNRGPNG